MNQREAQEHFGVRSTSTWALWVDRGMPRTPRGRGFTYDPDAIAKWLAANPQPTVGGDIATEELYKRERALKTAAQRELEELKLAEERGELLRRDEVEANQREAVTYTRARLLDLPASLAATLADEHTPGGCEAILTKAIHDVLREFAGRSGDAASG